MTVITLTRSLLIGLLVSAALPLAAAAQSQSRVAAGLGVSRFHPADERMDDVLGIGPLFRLRGGDGWGPAIGLSWFSSRVETTVDGDAAPLGELRIRPFMGGVSYTIDRGALTTVVAVVAGYAFNKIEIDEETRDALARRPGWRAVAIEAGNSPAGRAGVTFWFDVGPKIGVMTSAAYLVTRPAVTVATEAGRERSRWKADSLVLSAGIVYGIF